MSWGALNNRRERTSTDPLPDFLTELDVKSFNDRNESHPREMEEVITRRSDRSSLPLSEFSRGYGVSYPGTIDIRMSKKTLFILMIFFTATVLMAFCIGYAAGGSNNMAPQAISSNLMPSKKPIIPIRAKELQKSTPVIKTPPITQPLATPTENTNTDTIESKDLEASSSLQNNNKDNNDSEAVYEEVDPSVEDNDVVD
jgi:hypothetical protein